MTLSPPRWSRGRGFRGLGRIWLANWLGMFLRGLHKLPAGDEGVGLSSEILPSRSELAVDMNLRVLFDIVRYGKGLRQVVNPRVFHALVLLWSLAISAAVPAFGQQLSSSLIPFASLPLNRSELLYLLQNGASKKVAVGDMLAGVSGIPSAGTNATLTTLGSSGTPVILRTGFYAPGDGTPPMYFFGTPGTCATRGLPNDGAQCVNDGTGNSFTGVLGPVADPRQWGATGSASASTCAVNNVTLTCGSTADFLPGQPVAILGAGNTSAAATPTITVTAVNGTGTTYFYTAVGFDANMAPTAASPIVSVSGGGNGGVLGTPRDYDSGLTGDLHGTTTIDNLKVGGNPCTPTTCPLVAGQGMVVQHDGSLAIPTTISAVVSPTQITVNTPALVTNTGVTLSMKSPNEGVYNKVHVAGSAVSYAIYFNSVNSLAGMTCIGVLDGNSVLNGGNFKDFGPSNSTPCPSWIPTTPPAAAGKGTLLTTITSIQNGNKIIIANGSTANPASASVIHNDTPSLAAAVAWTGSTRWPCGTFNIFSGLSENSPAVTDLSRCATIAGWGSGFDDFTMATGSGSGKLVNAAFDDTQKSSNFALTFNGPTRRIVSESLVFVNACNIMQVVQSADLNINNVGFSGTRRCDVGVYVHNSLTPTFENVVIGPSVTGGCFVEDSSTNSLILINFVCQTSPRQFVIQNTLSGGNVPFANRWIDVACNFGWGGPCLDIEAGSGQQTFQRFYGQCVGGGNGIAGSGGAPSVFIAAGVQSVAILDHSELFACDKQGVDYFGNHLHISDGSVEVYTNSAVQHGLYPKVAIESGAGPADIHLAPGDSFATQANITRESCGIQIASGAGGSPQSPPQGTPSFVVDTNAPGLTAPLCDQTGVYGLVQTDGQLNSPTNSTSTTGVTLATATLLAPDPHQISAFYRSGPTAPFTDTTSTAAQIVTALQAKIPAMVAGTTVSFRYWNLAPFLATIAAGAGVSPGTCGTVPANGGVHVIAFTVTNVGTPAVTCSVAQ